MTLKDLRKKSILSKSVNKHCDHIVIMLPNPMMFNYFDTRIVLENKTAILKSQFSLILVDRVF